MFTLSDVRNEVDLFLSRASIFSTPVNITQLVICLAHRGVLSIGWRHSANGRCRIPVSLLLRHSDDVLKKPRQDSVKPTRSFAEGKCDPPWENVH